MTNIDQFESVFKAADKPVFRREAVRITSVLVVTDSGEDASERFLSAARSLLRVLDGDQPTWDVARGGQFGRVSELLEIVRRRQPDLICTYRNLHATAVEHPYSLGTYVDVLTQATTVPVLLLPHPKLNTARSWTSGTKSVMAITDRLTSDDRLVNYGVRFTEPGGKLLLAHVEDETTYRRYIATIGKIPELDTEVAGETILEQLLKEPADYIASCRQVLEAEQTPLAIEESITLGHHLTDYKRLIEEHNVNLVVLNTKDEGQLAMHGVGYSLSVELRDIPLLLL